MLIPLISFVTVFCAVTSAIHRNAAKQQKREQQSYTCDYLGRPEGAIHFVAHAPARRNGLDRRSRGSGLAIGSSL
jgi:hypothetical protein